MAHQPPISGSFTCTAEGEYDTQVTCDVLCSLAGGGGQRGSSAASRTSASDNSMHPLISPSAAAAATATSVAEKPKPLSCPKQHQLPMFLSSKLITSSSRCQKTSSSHRFFKKFFNPRAYLCRSGFSHVKLVL